MDTVRYNSIGLQVYSYFNINTFFHANWQSITSTISSIRDSSDADTTIAGDAEHYRGLCKEMLKKQVFLGQFIEKKFVRSIEAYRDLIEVDSSEAAMFGRLLGFVSSRLLRTTQLEHTWIGISLRESATPAQQRWAVWTQLPDGLAFGEYLFKVKTISFKPNEIYLKLKVVHDRDGSENPISAPSAQANIQIEDVVNALNQLYVDAKVGFESVWSARTQLTFLGVLVAIKNCLKYGAAALLLLGAFIFEAIPSIGRFTLRFSAELRKFLVVLSPFLMGVLHLANNAVGGFYILLAMIWRDSVNGLAARREQHQRQRDAPKREMIDHRPYSEREKWFLNQEES